MRLPGILIILALFGFLGWQIWGNSVDQSNPDAVAKAFIKAVKGQNIKRAAEFWVPEGAEAWKTSAESQIKNMRGTEYSGFFEGLPAEPVFVSSHGPKAPANEQTLDSGGTKVDLRQIDGKWYVCKSPL